MKIVIFSYSHAFGASAREVLVGIFPSRLVRKTRMAGLSDGEKNLYMYNRLDRIPVWTHGQTDILLRYSRRYACAIEMAYLLLLPPPRRTNADRRRRSVQLLSLPLPPPPTHVFVCYVVVIAEIYNANTNSSCRHSLTVAVGALW